VIEMKSKTAFAWGIWALICSIYGGGMFLLRQTDIVGFLFMQIVAFISIMNGEAELKQAIRKAAQATEKAGEKR